MMSSRRKLTANRRNAQRSTRPRTVQGMARAKLNAWQHGLSVKLDSNSTISPEVEQLAAALAGPNPDPVRRHFAVIAAEAEMELLRVSAVRKVLVRSKTSRGGSTASLDTQAYREALPDLERY